MIYQFEPLGQSATEAACQVFDDLLGLVIVGIACYTTEHDHLPHINYTLTGIIYLYPSVFIPKRV